MTSFRVLWTLLLAAWPNNVQGDAQDMKCQSTKLVVYSVTFSTFWDRETFPKHYPEWRPPAQWSKLVGKQFLWGPDSRSGVLHIVLFQFLALKRDNESASCQVITLISNVGLA